MLILHKNRALALVPAIAAKMAPCCCNPLSYGVSQSERRLLSCLKSTFSDEAMGVSTRHFLTILALKPADRASPASGSLAVNLYSRQQSRKAVIRLAFFNSIL